MDRRLLFVVLAGLVIAGVCMARLWINRPMSYSDQVAAATSSAPAPLFEGLDEHNQMFRLSAFLGRHRIIVVFYDGAVGVERSAELLQLKEHAAELKQQDVKAVAVSQAIPQENRRALSVIGELPCPLVSDVDGSIHQRWGRMSVEGRPRTGLFLIDRKGSVAFHAGAPRPYADFDSLWKDVVHSWSPSKL